MTNQIQVEIAMDETARLIKKWTLRGMDAHNVYVILRAFALSLERSIEETFPEGAAARIAKLQQDAFMVSAFIHPVRVQK